MEALRAELDRVLSTPAPNPVQAALLLEKEEHPTIDMQPPLREITRWAALVDERLGGARAPLALAETISEVLFGELGFRGNQDDYYQPQNSCLTQVIERRLGIPITLSMLYLGICHHLRTPVHGVGFPGRFLTLIGEPGHGVLCDPFEGGRVLDKEGAEKLLRHYFGAGAELKPDHLETLSTRATLARMQRNLKLIYLRANNFSAALGASDRIVFLLPEEADERRDRGLLFERLECFDAARRDYERYLEMRGNGCDDASLIREKLLDATRRAAFMN